MVAAPSNSGAKGKAPAVDFSNDVRPILSRHCFKCHGPDEKTRKGGLRLDTKEALTKPAKSGTVAIQAHKPDKSEVVRRITTADKDDLMPPPETKNPLTDAQKSILREWIASGAEYKEHWAFVAPRPRSYPKVKQHGWARNGIDRFVLARLEAEGLKPSHEADAYSIVRRVYLDLIGIPPTPEEADAFAHDRSPKAYERLVDKLLASPHYGERWGRRWLDLARYADTNGYEKDRPRSIWPYRDWVIRSLNADMPFDEFTIEQLAGDLLPNATEDQRIATGFHRNTMLNEEGGIDPQEYRFYSMVDRMSTTGAAWLGLTLGCAQCHTHKYDPISHTEYYQLMACMDNADEPEIDVVKDDIRAKRTDIEKKIALLLADFPNKFPVQSLRWQTNAPTAARSEKGATAKVLGDGSVLISGENPETDSYVVELETTWEEIRSVRLEALTHESLPKKGPGRVAHGNFVLSEFTASFLPKGATGEPTPIKFSRAEADISQNGFPVAEAIDGNPKTGWAIHTDGDWNVNRMATFTIDPPVKFTGGGKLVFKLDQLHGGQHTLGRFRISLAQDIRDERPIDARRQELADAGFKKWLEKERARTVRWTTLRPVKAKANLPLLTVLPDDSVLASGDQTKSDTYDLEYRTDLRGITAIRLDALTDDSLPRHGPGRTYFEGPIGDFTLSEITLRAGDTNLAFSAASHSFAAGHLTAAAAIDGDPQLGWSIDGGQGRPQHAVFNLRDPLPTGEFALRMLFERHYPAGLGRFKISVTTDATTKPEARDIPGDVEDLLRVADASLTPAQRNRLMQQYLLQAPEMGQAREELVSLRRQMPVYPTTLVMRERPPENPRPTFVRKRGEFLQPAERVTAQIPAFLPKLPAGASTNRLSFARWLVSPSNPLVARVTVNRQWSAFFGRGLVRTLEDFGLQGETPTHPELLDWLALEFVKEGWSMKKLHKMIVMSATYRQSSQTTPELLAKDAENRLLARGPHVRIEAELVRDAALKASGLLSEKLGGPSVFPPQPASITTEGAYGALEWKTSQGEDRYRRGIYTFGKRTAPYAMFIAFDAPSGEACVARRDVSNTPLQALTLLNDTVFVEATQALGRSLAGAAGSFDDRLKTLFRLCLTRPPSSEELAMLKKFYETQHHRFEAKELDAKTVAGDGDGDPVERAAWTVLARVLLNLDEAITKG